MIKTIKSFMCVLFYLLINASISISLDTFPENIQPNDGWKIFGDARITTPFSVEFSMHNVSTKSGNAIYNTYDLSKGNGFEISFKLSIKKESIFPRKKNGTQSFAVIFSKKLVKDWAELNDEKNDLIMLKFEPTKKNPEKFKHSIFQSFKGQINFSNVGNIHSRNLFCIQILNNKLFIYFNKKNVRTIDVQEILEQDKIYVTMLSTLSRKLILNDFKTKTLSEAPEKESNITLSKKSQDELLSKDFPKLRKLSNSNNYINIWIIGEKNEKANFISESFAIEPFKIYVKEQNQEKKLDSKFYIISQTNIPAQIKLIFNNKLDKCPKMFQGCANIISIDFSNIDINCNKMNFMFEGCSKLEEINFKNIFNI